jgi:Outer membrane protein beta-barrel domain
MSNKKNLILSVLLLMLPGASLLAQFRLPAMDVQVKSGVAFLDEMRDRNNNEYDYRAPVIHGEINFNVSQHFAAGAFISKGLSGQTEVVGNDGNTYYNSSHQSYGVKLRISMGRQPRFRPFAELSYGKFEMYMEKDFYRISTSSTFFGGSIGLMIRLNNKLYLVLPQISVRPRSDPFFFEVPVDFPLSSYPPLIEITGGVTYNFGKKK